MLNILSNFLDFREMLRAFNDSNSIILGIKGELNLYKYIQLLPFAFVIQRYSFKVIFIELKNLLFIRFIKTRRRWGVNLNPRLN